MIARLLGILIVLVLVLIPAWFVIMLFRYWMKKKELKLKGGENL